MRDLTHFLCVGIRVQFHSPEGAISLKLEIKLGIEGTDIVDAILNRRERDWSGHEEQVGTYMFKVKTLVF